VKNLATRFRVGSRFRPSASGRKQIFCIMQRATRPPMEWATRYTLGAPVFSRMSMMRSYSPAAADSMPNPSAVTF
jgi:hypothetical protein